MAKSGPQTETAETTEAGGALMIRTQICEWCQQPMPFNAKKHFCSKACWRAHYNSGRRLIEKAPRTKPHKKKQVACVVLGIEIPQLAWNRCLWLRCLIQKIKEQYHETVIE
jgi:hypothetical protein